MAGYHLSPLRTKGWLRAGLVLAALMVPLAGMGYALGYFAEDMRGLVQASEFVAAGACGALILGSTIGWVLRGFAIRHKEEVEDRDSDRPPARPAAAPTRPAGAPPAGGRH
jgi:hypothetical protein